MAVVAGVQHAGHAIERFARPLAHSRQNKLWPQGTNAAVTARSVHNAHPRGEPLGEGRVVDENAHTPAGFSKLGDSPNPSSRSRSRSRSAGDQILARPGAQDPEPEDPEDTDPDDEKTPDEHDWATGVASKRPMYGFVKSNVPNTSDSSEPPTTVPPAVPAPVRTAMWASISFLAASTLSGKPVTSKTGSLSRDGVTMYVWVCCWILLIVAPLGPTTRPTTR